MSAVLNDRDAILQAAATRIVNPKNADILLSQSAPAFHVTAGGAADVASITVSATLVGLEGAVSWSVQGATLSNVTDREATVTYANMQGTTAIVTASMMSSGATFAKSCVLATIQDGAPGSSAKTVKLTPSEQVFKINKAGAGSPASITLTATGQNTAGTPSFTIPVGTATLTAGSSSAQKVLTLANMATDQVTIEVTLDGQKDRVTIYKVREGQDGQPGVDAVVGLLTNETVTLPADSNGVVSSFSGAVCTMKVYKGAADDSANWTYAFAPASTANSLSYTTSGATLTVTGMAAGVDSAYVDITATKTGAAAITKRFTVTKSKAGASVTGARGAGQYYVVGSAWSDVAAQAACPGGPVVNDQVTISNGTVTYTKRWDGAAWNVPGAYLSGSLFVEGDIDGSKLKVGTVEVRAKDGTPVVTIGGLQPGFEAPGTKNSEQQWGDVQGIPYESILNNDDSVAMGFNPTFADWPSGQARPTGWSGSSPVRETAIRRLGQWAIRFNTPGGTQIGMNRRVALPTALPLGTFIAGTYDVHVARIDPANTTGKPGLMVRLWWGTANGEYTDRHFPASQTIGAWQRINFTARPAAGKQILQVEFYLFGSFSNSAYGGHFFGDVVFDNFRFALFDNTLDNTAISISSDGKLGGAGGGQVTITGLGYNGALDATKGAPTGTMVGGTEAGLVASRALNGQSAFDAVNHTTTGLAAKLQASGNQNLTGPIALTANGAIVVGNTTTGVVMNTGGVTLRKNGQTTVALNVDGTAYYAGELGAGIVTASSMAISSNPDNILPDPRFKDLVWWGMAGSNCSVGDWSDRDTAWRDSASLYMGAEGESVKQSAWFTVQKGARYRLEIQTGPGAGFAGQCSIFLFFEDVAFKSIGQPNKYNWPAYSLPCQYDSNSPKQLQSFSEEYVVPANATGRCRVVVIKKIDAGTFEFGSIRITRMVDTTLIGPGSVGTKHLEISVGGDINSGMPTWGTGRGFRFEGDLPGQHPARMAVGEFGGPGVVWDGYDLVINRPKLASPFSVQLTNVRITQQINGSTIQFSAPKTITSGSGSYSYTWSFSSSSGSRMEMISSPAATDAVIKATGSSIWLYGYLALTLKDLNSGLTSTSSCELVVQFGSGAEP